MDMDLIVIFSFVVMIVLIITAGVVLYPISRKLGRYLEEAAIERREARMSGHAPQTHHPQAIAAPPPQFMEMLARLETQLEGVADRQEFVERLLEEKQAELQQGAFPAD